MRPKTEKLLEENMGGNLLHISLGNHFFGYDTTSAGIKRKIKACPNPVAGLYQQKQKQNTAKETFKMKRQLMKWEKILVNLI